MARRKTPRIRKGQLDVTLTRKEFERRLAERFFDPAFDKVRPELEKVAGVLWENYDEYRKSPRTRPAGKGFADPDFPLPVEWLDARERIRQAQRRQKDPAGPSRVLVVCGAARNDQTCPGEMSKSFRLARLAVDALAKEKFETDFLDLSRLTAEYGRIIHPCKACVSTAMPLCHWPCSCYPNHALGQVQDWMNDIYPLWAAAHGVLIVTPVYWYQAPSPLKLMMDRLVCADGGNPDPTSTKGKDPALAKKLEMDGWPFPRHLAGRAFALVVHGDAAGVDNLKQILHDWLVDMDLVPSEPGGAVARYVGYYEPYASSHDALDRDKALQEEVRNAARSLAATVRALRSGDLVPPNRGLRDPRPK